MTPPFHEALTEELRVKLTKYGIVLNPDDEAEQAYLNKLLAAALDSLHSPMKAFAKFSQPFLVTVAAGVVQRAEELIEAYGQRIIDED